MGASIKVLTHLPLFEFESAILIVIVRGTDKTIPTGPKTQPQNNNDRKIRLFSTVSSENYENSNISLEKLGNLNFIYPSNSKPSMSFEYNNFYENYIEIYGNEPDRISIKARDLTYDLILRIAVFKKFENSPILFSSFKY